MFKHVMTPTAVAALLLLALVVDYMSVGPNSWRDRIAFFFALPAFYEGFNGSSLDRWTVDLLGSGIKQLLSMTGDAYIAGASVNILVGIVVGIVFLHALGCLLPMKATKYFGRIATLAWPESPMRRLNAQLWFCAIFIGMLCDLPQGLIGGATEGFVMMVRNLIAPLPMFLFGGGVAGSEGAGWQGN